MIQLGILMETYGGWYNKKRGIAVWERNNKDNKEFVMINEQKEIVVSEFPYQMSDCVIIPRICPGYLAKRFIVECIENGIHTELKHMFSQFLDEDYPVFIDETVNKETIEKGHVFMRKFYELLESDEEIESDFDKNNYMLELSRHWCVCNDINIDM